MKTNFRWTLSAGLAVASGLTGGGPAVAAAVSKTTPAITIHVRNYAGIDPRTLAEAEHVATEIFRKAGVETRWQEIVLTTENGHEYSADHKTFNLTDIQVNLFPAVVSDRAGLSDNVMGLAPGAGPDRGLVFVFDGKVKALFLGILNAYLRGDLDRRVSEGQLLGHVMAHEIGHLLLNQQVHSPHGIMRGEWVLADFRDMSSGMLLFTPQQDEFLRAEVRSRNMRPETNKVVELESPAQALAP